MQIKDTSTSSVSNSSHVPDLGIDIEFNTKSDALLSAFMLSHEQETRLDLVDAFFRLLHNPDFHSTDVSFENIESIYAHIAGYRRVLSEKRLTPGATATMTTPIPALIVDLVADMLGYEILAFEELVSRIDDNVTRDPHAACPEELTLRSMSLVHRSWTRAAQRALRHRLAVVGLKGLHKVLRNPHVGPWVRELSYTSPTLTHYWSGFEGLDDITEVSRLLLALLKLCPNVRKLHIKSCFKHRGDLSSFGLILDEIGNLKRLDTLWLTHCRAFYGTDDTPSMPAFLTILPKMKFLKRLSLHGWSTRPFSDRLPDDCSLGMLDAQSPTTNLEALSFALPFHCDFQHSGFLSWLFRPRGDFILTSIDVSCRDLFKLADWEALPLFGALMPLLPRILHLQLSACTFEIRPLMFLEKCTALRSLVLVYDDDFTLERIRLPSTLKSLRIHFTRYPDQAQMQDDYALKTVSGAQHIKTLSMTATRQRFPENVEDDNVPLAEDAEPRLAFPKTATFCAINKIGFHTDLNMRLPAFFSGL